MLKLYVKTLAETGGRCKSEVYGSSGMMSISTLGS
jgi:hypothetical protein